jgi:CheY-like chemotaxis protein
VLIVEDEYIFLVIIETAVSDAGFSVRTASDGSAAMRAIDETEDLKALVTDVRLGGGPDGWAVAQHARTKFRDIAIVYVTGDSGHDWPIHGVPKSVLVQKPFACAQIVTALAQLLNAADGG